MQSSRMQVFKFGGASVDSVERIKQIPAILDKYRDEPLLIVISAMGKTTNALEKVVQAFYDGKQDEALKLFHQVKQQHLNTAKYLLVTQALACEDQLANFFTEAEWLLHDKPVRSFDYYYDQVVSIGELLSTSIIGFYLLECGLDVTWLDVRDLLRTDNSFRDAVIDMEYTRSQVMSQVKPLLQNGRRVITQGFIGSTSENENTTLGREGSDYTGAVFANLLDAESLVIWKDVAGVMNSDPKHFPDAVLIPELNYDEVIEMAYYGAQVIHPKTIKPLQNKQIPLLVKCFVDSSLPGTVIHRCTLKGLPPIIVIKKNQVLLQLHSRDFSFVGEKPVAQLYGILAEHKIKPNLLQNGAVTISVCVDDRSEKIEALALEASAIFDVQVEKGLELLTIRHYTEELLTRMTRNRKAELRQQTPETVQVLLTAG